MIAPAALPPEPIAIEPAPLPSTPETEPTNEHAPLPITNPIAFTDSPRQPDVEHIGQKASRPARPAGLWLIGAAIVAVAAFAGWQALRPTLFAQQQVAAAHTSTPMVLPPLPRPQQAVAVAVPTAAEAGADRPSAPATIVTHPLTTAITRQVNSDNTKVRALPTTESKVLGELPRGRMINPNAIAPDLRGPSFGDWYQIEENAITGYVAVSTTSAPGAATPEPPQPPVAVAPAVRRAPPGLRVVVKDQDVRVRSGPSAQSSQVGTTRVPIGATLTPVGIADDAGGNPGKLWYKINEPVVGFVAAWYTRPASVSPAPAPAAPAPEPARPRVDDPPATTSPRIIANPTFSQRPSQRDIANAYPEAARQRGREASFSLECTVLIDGNLECPRPSGLLVDRSFVDAGLALARKYRLAATDNAGRPTVGRVIYLPIVFKLS